MQEKMLFTSKKAAVALCFVLLMVIQQVCAGPLSPQDQPSSYPDGASRSENTMHAPKRQARMTPLWRIMNSKPFGAFCQDNYECKTGFCRMGLCSSNHRSPSEPANY